MKLKHCQRTGRLLLQNWKDNQANNSISCAAVTSSSYQQSFSSQGSEASETSHPPLPREFHVDLFASYKCMMASHAPDICPSGWHYVCLAVSEVQSSVELKLICKRGWFAGARGRKATLLRMLEAQQGPTPADTLWSMAQESPDANLKSKAFMKQMLQQLRKDLFVRTTPLGSQFGYQLTENYRHKIRKHFQAPEEVK